MKNLINKLFYFSFPERRALVIFFSFISLFWVGEELRKYLWPPTNHMDLGIYESFFEKAQPSGQDEEDRHASDILIGKNSYKQKEKKRDIQHKTKSLHSNSREGLNLEANMHRKDPVVSEFKDMSNDDSLAEGGGELPSRRLININKAEEYELQYVKGIGPTFAKRIVKYRSLLGGFYSIEQLKEVYGIRDEQFEKISPQVMVQGPIKKFSLCNEDGSLIKHPYLKFQEVKVIAAYCRQHGPIINKQDLYKIKILDSTTINKVIPYIFTPSEENPSQL